MLSIGDQQEVENGVPNMTRKMFLSLVAVFALVLACAEYIHAEESGIPGPVVRTTLSDPQRDYELRGVALSADGAKTELLIAVRLRDRGREVENLVWATVDGAGQILSQQNPVSALTTTDAVTLNPRSFDGGGGFAFFSGRGFLLVPTIDGYMRMLRLTHSNESSGISTVKFGGRSPVIRRTLVTSDGNLVFVGSVGVQPLLAEINREGEMIAEYHPGEEGMTLINALEDSPGNILLIGEQGTFSNGTTWVGRMSTKGEILAKASFSGRPTDVARGSDGSYLLLIEKNSANGSEILMKSLAPNLSELWSKSLANRQRPGTSFRAVPIASGGFIVGGMKDRGLWITRISSDGTQIWSDLNEPTKSTEMELVSHVELASVKDNFVAAYTAFVVVGREQRQVVRVIRFKAN